MSKQRLFADEDSDVGLSDPITDDDNEEIVCDEAVEDNDDFELRPKAKVGLLRNFTDCSNVFKAFIGSALIGLPFAVLQAGLVLAGICILLIAFATDHCCNLIVKCKRLAIAKILKEKRAAGATAEELRQQEDILGRTLSFGRIGKACLGRPGLLAVNVSVMVTQFGFSTGYFIFLGNTLRTVIKFFVVPENKNASMALTSNLSVSLPTTQTILTTVPFTLAGNTTLLSSSQNHTMLNILKEHVHYVLHHVVDHLARDPWSVRSLTSNSIVTFGMLLVVPFLILVPISFIRNLRKLGPVSVLANTSITIAFVSTAVYIISKMHGIAPKPLVLFKKKTFPVFFGQVTGAFEGIGTVIPIEGSMAENRHRYPLFLHISLFLDGLILGSFGVIGYLAYGEHTCQIVTSNLKGDFSIALQILLFIGVLFTYPLQIYPCILITERMCIKFKQWRLRKKLASKGNCIQGEEEEGETLLDSTTSSMSVDDHVKAVSIKRWEGNLIRIGLVTFTACIALVFRSQFAYIAALTGSIGSSLLSYILPPVFHISLQKKKMKRWVFLKNIFLILFGIVGGLMGFIVTVKEIVESFDSGHPKHC